MILRFVNFAIILIVFIGLSCSEHKPTTNNNTCESVKGSRLSLNGNLTFQSGFNSGNAQIEKFNSEEFICFANFQTDKEIAIHGLTSNIEYHIPLDEVLLTGNKIQAFEIINLDTIIVLSQYSSKVFFINSEGTIWKYIDFEPYLKTMGDFEIWRGNTPFMFNDSSALFPILSKPMSSVGIDKYQSYEYYYGKAYAEPSLVFVPNIYSDSLSFTIGLKGLYDNFTDSNRLAIEGRNFTYINNQILFFSQYSDTLYQINPQTLALESKIKISSKFSELYITPIEIQEYLDDSSLLNKNFKSNGMISDVLYSPANKVYLVIAKHKFDSSKNRPWSIIFYDENFSLVDEVLMDNSRFYNQVYMTSNGILISNYYEAIKSPNHFNENSFAVFKYK